MNALDDFLGLKTLDQIRDAVHMIERNTGESIDMSAIDVADPDVYEMLSCGDSTGVFQVESEGMKGLLNTLRRMVSSMKEEDIKKIWGGNVIRLLGEAEEYAASLKE